MLIHPPILPITIKAKIEKIVNKIISLYNTFVQYKGKSMESKKWYQSKLVWLGILMTFSGTIEVAQKIISAGPIDTAAIMNLAGGVITVIMRVWFTSTQIQ